MTVAFWAVALFATTALVRALPWVQGHKALNNFLFDAEVLFAVVSLLMLLVLVRW